MKEKLIDLLEEIVGAIISAALLMWGWNTIAPHLNAPTFGLWEMFAMRLGAIQVMHIIKRK